MDALGFIETKGLVAAVEAADSALKSANVSLIGKKTVGFGLVTVIITGSVAAVKSAVETGKESASGVGEVISAQVIARPHSDLEQIIYDRSKRAGEGKGPAPKAPTTAKPAGAKPPQKRKSPGV